MSGARVLAVLGLGAALAVGGCHAGQAAGQADGAAGGDGGNYFVAFAPDFYGFRTWSSAPAVPIATLPPPPVPDGGADGGIHVGMLTVFWNAPPPAGSSRFPVGTIIVKETDGGAVTSRQVFAMVKRGGDFNAGGAVDWEWFELMNIDDQHVTVVWRGVGPPAGERYGGNPATCNDCHLRAASNDDVWSSALALASGAPSG